MRKGPISYVCGASINYKFHIVRFFLVFLEERSGRVEPRHGWNTTGEMCGQALKHTRCQYHRNDGLGLACAVVALYASLCSCMHAGLADTAQKLCVVFARVYAGAHFSACGKKWRRVLSIVHTTASRYVCCNTSAKTQHWLRGEPRISLWGLEQSTPREDTHHHHSSLRDKPTAFKADRVVDVAGNPRSSYFFNHVFSCQTHTPSLELRQIPPDLQRQLVVGAGLKQLVDLDP